MDSQSMYRIKVVQYCKRDSVIATYCAPTHPAVNGTLWIGQQRYIVAAVSHVVTTLDVGTYDERNVLSFVELEVMK